MIATARLTLPLFLFLNLVFTQNGWTIGVYFYYMSLVVAFFLLLQTKFSKISIIIIPLMMAAKILEFNIPSIGIFNVILAGVLFFLVGLITYGDKPQLIRRVLIFFLLLNIPIMLLQTSGASPVFMYWNTDYAHSLEILDLSEVGTFKEITQYPTLFTQIDDLYYQIGQGRPSGLMPANNLLSVIIVFGLVMNLYLRRNGIINIGDIVVNATVVISMSKLALFVACFLYLSEIAVKSKSSNLIAWKNLFILFLFYCIYYVFFPGILLYTFRLDSVLFSFGIRLIDLATTLGADNLLSILASSLEFYEASDFDEYGHTSGIALAIDSFIFAPSLILLIYCYYKFKNRIIFVKNHYYNSYHFFVKYIISVFFVFSVIPSFFFSPLFVMILSIGFFPFLRAQHH